MFNIAVRAILLGGVLALTFIAPAAAAQEITPTSAGKATSWVGTPPSSDCVVKPVKTAAVLDALRLPFSAADIAAFPLLTPSETDLPEGEPPTADQVDAVSATFWMMVACLNAGDYPRYLALFTDQGINRFVIGIGVVMGGTAAQLSDEQLAEMGTSIDTALVATPEPLPAEEQAGIKAIRDARVLPDGRVLLLADGTGSADGTFYAVFRLIDDRWMIDATGMIGVLPA